MYGDEMVAGKTYRVEVSEDGSYLGSAVLRRIGKHHVESSVTVRDDRYLSRVIDAVEKSIGAFSYMRVKPKLGQLIQKSIWDILEQEKDDNSSTNPDEPPPF